MISKEEIKRLADLSRIEVNDTELEKLASEMEVILEYVGQLKSITGEESEGVEVGLLKNVMRDDENQNVSGGYSQELIAEFPNKDKNYLKVKKIL